MTITQQEIIALAVEAGFPFNKYGLLQGDEHGEIDADEMFARLAALLLAKETQARQAAQLELEQYRSEAQRRAGVLIKEAYQRGVRDEREECAKVCEQSAGKVTMVQGDSTELVSLFLGQRISALEIAAERIRARSDK